MTDDKEIVHIDIGNNGGHGGITIRFLEEPDVKKGIEMKTDHHNHAELAKKEWAIYAAKYKLLKDTFADGEILVRKDWGALKLALEKCEDVDASFVDIVCIDEGINVIKVGDKKTLEIGIGGSGILMKDEELKDFVAYLVGLIKSGRTVRIWSHESCGAAGIHKKACDLTDSVDTTAKNFGERLQQLIEEAGYHVEHGTITMAEMTREEEIHNAFGAAILTTEEFNINDRTNDLPPMFNISDVYGNSAHVLANIKVAIDIAFGNHGFGEMFSSENPFILLLVKDSSDSESVQRFQEINEEIDLLIGAYQGRVVKKIVDIAN